MQFQSIFLASAALAMAVMAAPIIKPNSLATRDDVFGPADTNSFKDTKGADAEEAANGYQSYSDTRRREDAEEAANGYQSYSDTRK